MSPSEFPLISVIIPVYNRENYIVQTMDSVLKEDYPNLELVIIDDGSTDQSKAVIERWIQQHQNEITVHFIPQSNQGVVKTLNNLIRLAKGQYIVLLDSDDVLVNPGIRLRYEYLAQHPGKRAVFGDCHLIDEHGLRTADSALVAIGHVDRAALVTDFEIQKFFVLNGFTTGSTMMIERGVFDEIGFYDETLHSQDYTYQLRLAAKNWVGYINTPVSEYRRHQNNVSTSLFQVTLTLENMKAQCQVISWFKDWRLKYCVLLVFLHDCLKVPYLSVKLRLRACALDESQRGPLSALIKSVYYGLENCKTLFVSLTGKIYLKKTS